MDEEGQEIGGDRSRAVVREILQPLNPTLLILKFLLHGISSVSALQASRSSSILVLPL